MRVVLPILLVACGDGDPVRSTCAFTLDGTTVVAEIGEVFASPDGCNTCTCGDDLNVACTEKDCSASPCQPSGRCTDGPACGTECCDAGEKCLNDRCVCGASKAGCDPGETCVVDTRGTCGTTCR